MTEHNLFFYPYASFTNEQLPRLKVDALYFDKLNILDPVGASWATVGAGFRAREAVMQLRDAGILQIVTPAWRRVRSLGLIGYSSGKSF